MHIDSNQWESHAFTRDEAHLRSASLGSDLDQAQVCVVCVARVQAPPVSLRRKHSAPLAVTVMEVQPWGLSRHVCLQSETVINNGVGSVSIFVAPKP